MGLLCASTSIYLQTALFPSFSIGLFNFFEYSISQLKFEVLKIFEKYYVDSVAVLPMLVGLVNAIMPGLNENH